MHIAALYLQLKDEPGADIVPRTFVFAGKAAPGYATAKRHIRLVSDIAGIVNEDESLKGRLAVVFLPNYGVTLAERIIPSADLSLQTSLAGTEASGTGNMKLAMNGALTAGTLDGANVEIRDAVGADAFFLFGMTTPEVLAARSAGYCPSQFIEGSETLGRVLGLIRSGFFSPDDPSRGAGIAQYLEQYDPFMACADFDDYLRCQAEVEAVYRDRRAWMQKVVQNVAGMGRFSSDETIRRYARDIWDASPVPIDY